MRKTFGMNKHQKAAHRVGDPDKHCGGMGEMKDGSTNVMTGG